MPNLWLALLAQPPSACLLLSPWQHHENHVPDKTTTLRFVGNIDEQTQVQDLGQVQDPSDTAQMSMEVGIDPNAGMPLLVIIHFLDLFHFATGPDGSFYFSQSESCENVAHNLTCSHQFASNLFRPQMMLAHLYRPSQPCSRMLSLVALKGREEFLLVA